MPDTCACCMHDFDNDHVPTTDGRRECIYVYPVGGGQCQCIDFEEKMPQGCDSGVDLPDDDTLQDDDWDYCVAPCGYVVRYLPGRWVQHGQPAIDRHNQEAHPGRYAATEFARRMSED